MISVVIPARNAAGTIGAALRSLVGASSLIGEILLVDDDSTDGTSRAAAEAALGHGLPLRIIAGRFGGAGAARNAGLAEAVGEHVFYFDADDEVISNGLTRLHDALSREPAAGMAVGAVVRRTAGRPDKTKVPRGYGTDLMDNARRYLRNEIQDIAVGSALFAAAGVRDIRFPTAIGLGEDTWYWTALLTRLPVVAIDDPVLLYNLDEPRMMERFVSAPRAVLLGISLEFDKLAAFGIGRDVRQWRKAWVALRIARLLVMHRRYREAGCILRMVRAHPEFRRGWKSVQYQARIAAGRVAQTFGWRVPAASGRAGFSEAATPQRTLILTGDPAFPPVSGADLRNYRNAEAAAEFGSVLLVSVRPLERPAPADGKIGLAALSRKEEPRGKALVSRRTSVEVRIPETALPRLLRLARDFRPDTIIVEGVPLVAMMEQLRPLTRRLILDMHNIESPLAGGLRPKSPTEKLLPHSWSNQGRIERQERKALTLVDRVWVCSDADRDRLCALFRPGIPVDIVPNGIPRSGEAPSELPPLAGKDDGWPVLLFVGHLGYQPNVVAAERLAKSILPQVSRAFPSARLILAGRHPKPAVRDLAELPGVELVADPAGLSPLLARGHICALPLAAGGGTRIKILEAAAWGLPVVATALAAEGQEFWDGDEIMIAETDEAIARAVVALLAEPERLERQRRLAHEKVMLLYGPSAIENAVRRGFGLRGPAR